MIIKNFSFWYFLANAREYQGKSWKKCVEEDIIDFHEHYEKNYEN